MTVRLVLTCVIAVALASRPGARQSAATMESAVKAAFLFNFTKFVEWPGDAFQDESKPFIACMLGETPVAGNFADITKGERYRGRPFTTSVVASAAVSAECHILFVPLPETGRFAAGRDGNMRPGVLTVGESPDFLQRGGIINFVPEANKVRFEVDATSAERAKLKISSKLLRLARHVKDSDDSWMR
jgi:hypothetical protein